MAEFYLRAGDIEGARNTYEQALKSLDSVKEFSLIFAGYTQLEEEIVNICADDSDEAEKAISRLEKLLERREVLLSDVKLKHSDFIFWTGQQDLFKQIPGSFQLFRSIFFDKCIQITNPNIVNMRPSEFINALFINSKRLFSHFVFL